MSYTLDDVLRAIRTGLSDTLYYMFKAFCIEGAVAGIGSAIIQPVGAQVPSGKRTATRIVAASNSLDKTRADYVCDGIHDEEEINRAISDLALTGGTVLLLEGTYNIGSAGTKIIEFEGVYIELPYGIYITSNVRLVGQGRSTILVLDINNFNGNDRLNALILSDNKSVEISDLVVDGSQYGYYSLPMALVFLYNASNSSILNCTIQHSFVGVYIIGSNNCTVANNTVNDCMGFYGISVYKSNNCIVSGNVCNAGSGGIILYFSDGCVVSDNECCNTASTGIELYNSSNNYIGGNVCIANDWGIYVEANSSGNVICNNVLRMNGTAGICIGSNDNLISENLVVGNSAHGIFILGGSYNTASGNVLRHMNTQMYGIDNRGGTGNLIINNDLYQAGTSADFYDEGTGTVYHNNRTTQGWIP